mgnify:CR=1 FL=1
MPPKLIDLRFPTAGLNRRLAYKQQAPFTSPCMLNVRPSDTLLGRDRGGSRPGLAKSLALDLEAEFQYLGSVTWISAGVPVTQMMAIVEGQLYREFSGDWEEVSGATFPDTGRICGIERLQKIYFPVGGNSLLSGTNGTVDNPSPFTNDTATFTDPSVADWTAHGLNVGDIIALGSQGSYEILEINVDEIRIANIGHYPKTNVPPSTYIYVWSIVPTGGDVPQIYDPATNTVSDWEVAEGSYPAGVTFGWLWRDRIMLSGDPASPHIVYASRAGDPFDFDYSQDDAGAAFATNSGSQAGLIGRPVTSGFATNDDYCITGCADQLYLFRGDPTAGGEVMPLSINVGIIDQQAWCVTPSGWIYFLSLNGLYAIPPSANSRPIEISRATLPADLLAIDATAFRVLMAYDLRDSGIHLFVVPLSGTDPGTHYWITTDTEAGGGPRAQFFPASYPFDFEPTCLFARQDSTNAYSGVWLGCRDGFSRSHRDDQATDDGTPIDSYVVLGPIDLSGGSGYHEGRLKELVAKLASDSGEVDWEVTVGATAQDAFEADPFGVSGTWSMPGLNPKERPRARGAAFCLKLSSNERWALESLLAVIERAGVQRL